MEAAGYTKAFLAATAEAIDGENPARIDRSGTWIIVVGRERPVHSGSRIFIQEFPIEKRGSLD